MIKTFHEAPKSIFKDVQQVTGGDYALVHLCEEDPEYLQLFKDSVKKGREVILDNSIFELGKSFDPEKYIKYIQEINPTYYIIPDVLEDSDATCDQADAWFKRIEGLDLPGKTIGVVQGEHYDDIVACYAYLDRVLNVDKIAISFDYSYYARTFPHSNHLVSWTMGRVKLIGDLLRDGVINRDKPHHLLGVATAMEGYFYRDYEFIDSIDTSNPVVHAIKEINYRENIGLWTKESQKLCDLINTPQKDIDMQILFWNIMEFNNYWNGTK